jgi:hypothetical protein
MSSQSSRLQTLLPPPRCYARRPNSLPIESLVALQTAILASPYLADSQLDHAGFQGSRGFSVVFTRSGIHRVLSRFPEFEPYIQRALKSACNAFYLNPLLLAEGTGVAPHVDCSISSYGMEMAVPTLVSVLYIHIPSDMQGGNLILSLDDSEADSMNHQPLAVLQPQVNTLLHFLGFLTHSVTPVQSKHTRISLVCEQYTLSEERLASIPEFEILSGADASAVSL